MSTRPNDWIAVELNAPVSNTSDRFAEIYASGINSENTTLHEPDYYKNIPQVIDAFRNKDGELDEVSFNQFYKGAQSEYNEFSNLDYLEKYISQMERSPYDWTNLQAPVMNTSVVLAPVSDKNRTTQGLGNIWQTGTPTFSDREVAQAQKVRDENGNELDWTPNDKGGLKGLWRPTIVMATYDTDEFDENGRLIHQKGDLKLDWKGDPYPELLGDREVYGKEVITISDTLTKEGTIWNKLDPFDSDSIEKSVGKTVAETALKIAPWVIGSFTGITPYLAAVAILKELGGAMPSALKAINGFLGDEGSAYGKSLNEWESWMRRFDNSTSDEGRSKGFWNAENVGDIIASSFSQLAAQRTIGSLGKYLANDRIRQSKIGQELAKNYMALTSTVDAYQGFKDAGATDEWAGIGMFATYAAMYGLQSIGYFNKWIWRDTFLDENREIGNITRQWAMQRAKDMGIVKEAEKVATDAIKAKALSKQWFKNIYNSSKEFLQTLGNSDSTPNGETIGQIAATVAQRSLNEGIEETMEELSADIVKGLALGLNKLGVKVSENGVLDFGFTPESFLSRYSAAFVGGAVGGSIFEMYNRIDGYKNPLSYLGNTAAKMIWAHRNGYDDYIFDTLNSMMEKGEIPGNPNLTAYDFDFGENPDDAKYRDRIFKPAKNGDNQQQAVYDFVSRELKNLFNILDSNVIRSGDYQVKLMNLAAKEMSESRDKEIKDYHIASAEQKLLMDSGALDLAIMDLDLVGADIFDTQIALYKATQRFEAAKEVSEKNSAKQDVQTFTEKLKELQKEYDEIRTGKRADKYINFAYSALNTHILAGYLNSIPTENELNLGSEMFHEQSIERYAQLYHNIDDFESLSEAHKDYIKARWALYKSRTDDGKKARNAILFKLHYLLSGKYGAAIQKTGEKYKGYKRDIVLDKFEIIYDHMVNMRNELSNLQAIRAAAELNGDVDAVLKADSMIEETQKKLVGILEKEEKKVEALIEKQNSGIELSEAEQDTINDFGEFKELYTLLNVFEFTDSDERITYKQSILDFYAKFNSDKRMSNNTGILLTHFTNLLFNEIQRIRQNPIGLVKEERALTNNPFSDDIVMDLYSQIGNNALEIAGKFNMSEDNIKYLDLEINTFLDKLRMNPEKAEELYKAEIARVAEKVLHPSEKFNSEDGTIDQSAKQATIDERWTLIGMTPEEYFNKIMLPLDSQAVNEVREFSKSIAPLIDTKNNDLLKELLQDISIAVNGKPLNIFGRYETEYARYLSMLAHPDEFTIDDQSLSELKTALNMIRIVMSLVESAGNGHNKITNDYKRALEKTDFFAELDPNERMLLKSQLVYLYNQINGLVQLSDRNSISLTEEQKQITYNMAPKLIKVLFDYEDDDEDAIGKKIQNTLNINGEVVFDIKGWWTKWLSENSDVNLNNLTDKTYDKFVDARRKFYDELRKAVLDKKGLVSWQTIGEELAKNLGSSVSDMRATKFKRKSDRETVEDSVSAIDAATYFMSIIGSDLNQFELLSKDYFEETNQFLPFFAQEYAAQLTWASFKNQELFNGFLNTLERQLTNNASPKEIAYVQGMYKLNNFMMVDGVAGSGKSTGVAKLLAAVLKKENKNLKIVALSSIKSRYESIHETVGADASGSIDELLNDIFVDSSGKKVSYDRNVFGPTPDFSTSSETKSDHYLVSGIKTSQMQKFPAMVLQSDKDVLYIIDEVTQITEDKLMVLSEYIKKLKENGINVHVIGLGDSTQSHAYDIFADTPTNISTCTYLRTPQLTASLRKANRGVRDNNAQIEAWVKKGVDYYSKYPGLSLDLVDQKVKDLKPQAGITFIHHDDNDYFYGHEFVSDGKSQVELLLNKKPLIGEKSKVLIIVDDLSASKYNSYQTDEYKDRVAVRKLTDVQGDEYDYVVVDMGFDGTDQHYFESLRDFYTSITRARIGTKIVDRPVSRDRGGAKGIFGIDDRPTPDASFSIMDPESDRAKANNKAYKEWRLQRYGSLKKSSGKPKDQEGSDSGTGETGSGGENSGGSGGSTGGTGETGGTGGGNTGGSTGRTSLRVDPAKINENNFLNETDGEKTDDELKEEFAASGTILGNAYAKARSERADTGNTVLTDEEFLDYLRNTSSDELLLSNIDLEIKQENIIPLLTYVSSYVLSKLSANRAFGEDSKEVETTSGLRDKIQSIAGGYSTLINEAIQKNAWEIFIAQNGDKNIVYWVIRKDDQRLALPIAISNNKSLYGYFTTPQLDKINGIIPISSKGQKWVSVTRMMKEKGLILPDRYGLYVGTDERIKAGIGFVNYTKGKALIPLAEAWHTASWTDGSFFTSHEENGELIWLTKGYHERPEWRTHEVAMQKRISYATFIENARLLYDAFHETRDAIKRNDAREKLIKYFGWNPSELQPPSDSANASFRESGNSDFFKQARKYRLLSDYTCGMLISEIFNFAETTASIDESLAFFTNISQLLMGQKQSALRISYKTEDVPNAKPLVFYLVDEGLKDKTRNYKVYVEVPSGKNREYIPVDIKIPITANSNLGKLSISEISKQLIEKIKTTSIDERIAEKVSNLVKKNPKPMVGFGSVNYKDGNAKIYPISDYMLVKKVLSGEHMNGFNSSFENYLKNNNSELKHGLYAFEYRDWDDSVTSNFKTVAINGDDEKRQWDLVDIMLPGYRLSNQSMEHGEVKLSELDEITREFIASKINQSKKMSENNSEPSIGNNSGTPIKIDTQDGKSTFDNCYINKAVLDKYSDASVEEDGPFNLKNIDWAKETMLVGDTYYKILDPKAFKEFIEEQLSQIIEDKKTEFKWTIEGGSIKYDINKDQFEFNGSPIHRVAITYDSKSLILFNGTEIYEIPYRPEVKKPKIVIVARDNGAFLIQSESGLKELFNGAFNDISESDYGRYQFIYGYNPVIKVKPEIFTDGRSKIQQTGRIYKLTGVKANGAQLNQWLGQEAFDEDIKYLVHKIDFDANKITIGIPPVEYDLSSGFMKIESFGFDITPEVVIDKNAKWKAFVKDVKLKLPFLKDNILNELLVKNDIEKSLEILQAYFNDNKFILGKHVVIKLSESDEIIHTDNAGERGLYGHVSKVNKDGKIVDVDKIVDAEWVNDSNFTEFFVSLSDGTKMYIQIIRSGKNNSKITYKETIKELQYAADDLLTQIENSSLDDDMKNILKEAMTDGKKAEGLVAYMTVDPNSELNTLISSVLQSSLERELKCLTSN